MKFKIVYGALCSVVLLSGCSSISMPEAELTRDADVTVIPEYASASKEDKVFLRALLEYSPAEVGIDISQKELGENYEGATFRFNGALLSGKNFRPGRVFFGGRDLHNDLAVILRRDSIGGRAVLETKASPMVRIGYSIKDDGSVSSYINPHIYRQSGEAKRLLRDEIKNDAFLFNQLITQANQVVAKQYKKDLNTYQSLKNDEAKYPLISKGSNLSKLPKEYQDNLANSFHKATYRDLSSNNRYCFRKYSEYNSLAEYRQCILRDTRTGNLKINVGSDASLDADTLEMHAIKAGSQAGNSDLQFKFDSYRQLVITNKTDNFIEIVNSSEAFGGMVYSNIFESADVKLAPNSSDTFDLVMSAQKGHFRSVTLTLGKDVGATYKLNIQYKMNGKLKNFSHEFVTIIELD